MNSFTDNVLSIVRSIPRGSVLTYREVAERAGSPNASRAVGSIMKKNFLEDVPCHRVVRSDLGIGDYNRGGEVCKVELLTKEGVCIERGKVKR